MLKVEHYRTTGSIPCPKKNVKLNHSPGPYHDCWCPDLHHKVISDLDIGKVGLTHCGLVMPYGNIDLGLYWLRWRLGACLMAPSHYLNQCWLIISKILWHSPQSNFTARVQAAILYNEFENYTFKTSATSPCGQWVKWFFSFTTKDFKYLHSLRVRNL